jgi:rSAM/selenodomain-associated transferase 1
MPAPPPRFDAGPRVLIFLKAPQPGRVKTRLAASIGPRAACEVYKALVEQQLARLPKDWPVDVHFTPPGALDAMRRWLGHGYDYFPQVEGDLGDRLASAVQQTFQRGAGPVTCIGADCPSLNARHLNEALRALSRGADLVFGPASDGGYYLVGLKQAHTCIFRNIPWSAPNTLEASLRVAKQQGLRVEQLETLADVDTAEDLERAVTNGDLPQPGSQA